MEKSFLDKGEEKLNPQNQTPNFTLLISYHISCGHRGSFECYLVLLSSVYGSEGYSSWVHCMRKLFGF